MPIRATASCKKLSAPGLDPLLQQLLRIYALEQCIGDHCHSPQLRHLGAHLGDGVVWIHCAHGLDAAALLIAEEHGKRCHARAVEMKWGGLRCEECSPGTRCEDKPGGDDLS